VRFEDQTLGAIEKKSEETYKRIAVERLSGASMEKGLPQAMAAVAKEIERNVQFYSSMAWLCYLRLPTIRALTGWLNDGMETAHHAEMFTGKSKQQTLVGLEARPDGLVPIINPSRLRKVAQLIGGAFVYRQLRVFQSLTALDVSFHPTDSRQFPRPNPSEEQRRNLRAFNNRSHEQPMLLTTGAGVAVTTGEHDTEATTFPCVGFNDQTGRFGVGPLGLAKFKELRALEVAREETTQEIGDVLLALKVGYIAARNKGFLDDVTRYGLVCMQAHWLAQFFDNAEPIVKSIRELLPTWDFTNGSATVQNLQASRSRINRPPTVRATREWLALDLHSASTLLNALLFESFDKNAPQRGPTLEDDVQRLIDISPWKPSPAIRAWRGRKLRVGKQALTDIDAIGDRGGTLLIVEVKAYYYSIPYGAAERSQARNVREKCEEAIRRCSPATLRSATNVNLAPFPNILRVVCTPTPVYCNAEYTIADENEFAPTMSYWELWSKFAHDAVRADAAG
jgi:hypothetical protein